MLGLDDAQWVDAASAGALQIALRRLDREPIGVLVTARDDLGLAPMLDLEHAFPAARLTRLPIGPMSLTSLHHMLRHRLSLELSRPELAQLLEVTEGNPFFALAVGREMARTHTRASDLVTMRVPESLRQLVGERLARLPRDTRDVLLEAAASARPTLDLLARVHGDPDTVAVALDIAAREGVISLEDGRVRFSHPLHASICYQQAPELERRAVHRALAAVVTDSEERARHLALAAEGPDAAIAAELDAAAESAAARGAPGAGAELYELAARLTPGDPRRAWTRRLRAASFHRISGNNERAIALLEQLRSEASPGPDRADVLVELVATRGFDIHTMVTLCDEALEEASGDDRRSARVLIYRTHARMLKGEVSLALVDARAALESAERANDPALIAMAIARIGHAETYATQITPGLTERGVEIERRLGFAFEYLNSPRRALARQQMRLGGVEDARQLLEELTTEATARGDERTRADALWGLTVVEWLAGRWEVALGYANEAAESVAQAQDIHVQGWVGRVKALVEADLGLVEQARASAAEGIAAARAMSDDLFEISSVAVLGRIELMLGNASRAAEILRDLLPRLLALGITDPTTSVWPDTIEALIASDDREGVGARIVQWHAHAQALGSPMALGAAARCQGLLAAAGGDVDGAIISFEQSLRTLEGFTYPLERARTLLCMGSVLRQAQQRTAARDALEQALAIFEELGGRLWAEKARAELARISGRRPPSETLTETEHQVATLAGQGRSNKEIAASLHMGVSTVEAHLSSIYRKLDVRRAGLGARLAESQ